MQKNEKIKINVVYQWMLHQLKSKQHCTLCINSSQKFEIQFTKARVDSGHGQYSGVQYNHQTLDTTL